MALRTGSIATNSSKLPKALTADTSFLVQESFEVHMRLAWLALAHRLWTVSSLQQLSTTILATAECGAEITKMEQAVRSCIATRVNHDFAKGAVVNIEGWLLSRTEAHLYALVALNIRGLI